MDPNVSELLSAAKDAVRFLMGKARRDPEEREIVQALSDAIANFEMEGDDDGTD